MYRMRKLGTRALMSALAEDSSQFTVDWAEERVHYGEPVVPPWRRRSRTPPATCNTLHVSASTYVYEQQYVYIIAICVYTFMYA